MEDDNGTHVYSQRDELAEQHQPVPRPDRHGDHYEFGDDERGEGDGHDVDEVVVEQVQRTEHDDGSLVKSFKVEVFDEQTLISVNSFKVEVFHEQTLISLKSFKVEVFHEQTLISVKCFKVEV